MWMGRSAQAVMRPACSPKANREVCCSVWMWIPRRSVWPARNSLPSGSVHGQAGSLHLPSPINWQNWAGNRVDGILLDLGASSMQFDTPKRGFSFLADGPLDMRFDPSNPLTAAEIVNSWPEQELADLIFRYGEEPACPPYRQGHCHCPTAGTGHRATGSHHREGPAQARSSPPRHADLPGSADRRQWRTGVD